MMLASVALWMAFAFGASLCAANALIFAANWRGRGPSLAPLLGAGALALSSAGFLAAGWPGMASVAAAMAVADLALGIGGMWWRDRDRAGTAAA